ncbi:nucleotide-binding universal stress UspA family protein [Microbacterium resistens]|uniref:Nucleotide-binding universal stress UspA family protein n=1 Tax=Microbacterium resistens TaxID=156977 RepID=A0ABU1SBC4_9MICO|nr:universal stress protein [Microbacterium resistens]MDR6866904.1 nucleotide-binding universal stress UspA family protein [Microbacterium resistens]
MEDTGQGRILVGVDGSESSINALRYASTLAEALDASLHVVTTWSFPALVDYRADMGWSPEADAAEILESSIATAFEGSPPPDLSTAVLAGPAAPALIEASRGAEMLVLGSRGRGGFVGLLLGSVSATCASHAHCPVLIIREAPHPAAG